MTQTNLFNKNFNGIGPKSHDLEFPNFEKIANAYNIPYYKIDDNQRMETIDQLLSLKGYFLCEVFVTTEQAFEPRSATKVTPSGELYSPPLEDMYPYLDEDEIRKNMVD